MALQVGRPRPNFMSRCFPEAVAEPVFVMGVPQCQAGNVHANTEGRKSFPSGRPGNFAVRPAMPVLPATMPSPALRLLVLHTWMLAHASATSYDFSLALYARHSGMVAVLCRSSPNPQLAPSGTRARCSCAAGHTSWSTSGLGFLSLWLMGKLHVFDGTGHPARLIAASVPISFAVYIGITRLQVGPCHALKRKLSKAGMHGPAALETRRPVGTMLVDAAELLQDYWHHWQDVTVGFFLGLTVAYLFYRQYFPGLTDPKAGEPLITRLDGRAPAGALAISHCWHCVVH